MKKSNLIVCFLFAVFIVLSTLTYFFNSDRKVLKVESFIRNYFIEAYSILPKAFAKEKNVNLKESLNQDLVKENEELKKLLELNHTLGEFSFVNATILSRNVNSWLDVVVIDKGGKDGIKVGDAVVTSRGLIGKVTTCNKDNSIVSLLTTRNSYYVSVSIGKNNGLSYEYDRKKQVLKVKGISKNAQIEKGEKVITNGLGGVFPSGIYVGKVEKIESDTYDLSKIVSVSLEDNFDTINYVVVIGKEK